MATEWWKNCVQDEMSRGTKTSPQLFRRDFWSGLSFPLENDRVPKSNQGAMAAPGHRLGAYQGDWFFPGHVDQHLQILRELRRLHVIGVTSERWVTPGSIRRVRARMPPATQPRHVRISEADGLQRGWQGVLVELRVVPRAWYRPHIHQPLRAMSLR